jgi:hypothetical protein
MRLIPKSDLGRMQPGLNNSRRRKLLVEWALCAFVLLASARAGQPKIDFIEPFLTYGVLIHFDVEANRYYQVQYTETLINGVPGGTWTNLLNQPVFYENTGGHFIALDTRLRPQRFYRLLVYP